VFPVLLLAASLAPAGADGRSCAIPELFRTIAGLDDQWSRSGAATPIEEALRGGAECAMAAARAGDPSALAALADGLSSLDYGKRKNRSAFDKIWTHLGATIGAKPVRWPGFAKVLGALSAEAEVAGHACAAAAGIEAERAVVLGLVELIGRLDEGPGRRLQAHETPDRTECMRALVTQLRGLGTRPPGVADVPGKRAAILAEALKIAAPPPLPEGERRRVVREFEPLFALAEAASGYEEWPARARGECVPFARDAGSQDLPWCSLCKLASPKWRATYSFYPDLVKGTCTLQEVEIRSSIADGLLQQDLRAFLDSRLGAGVRPSEGARIAEFGSGSWDSTWTWRRSHDLAYLFVDAKDKRRGGSASSGFLWRRDPLLARQQAAEEEAFRTSEDAEPREGDLALQACEAAGLKHCGRVSDLLEQANVSKKRSVKRPASSGGATKGERREPDFAAIERGLDAALGGALERLRGVPRTGPEYPALVYWTDFLAGMRGFLRYPRDPMPGWREHEAEWQARMKTLARDGLTYEDDHLGGDWVPVHTMLNEVALARQDSIWGQRAFLAMTRRGWDPHCCCTSDEDAFTPVIERGEKFLREHPDSRLFLDVLGEVAAAYETWWSLSKAGPQDVYASNPESYAEGAGPARQRAIELYRLYAEKRRKPSVQQVLFRLEKSIDTGQRRYFCIYD
jgi:hypothetical protein